MPIDETAETEEAGIHVDELSLDVGEVEEGVLNDVVELRMADFKRMPGDDEHAFDARIVKTLEQHAHAHHAGGAEDDDLHY